MSVNLINEFGDMPAGTVRGCELDRSLLPGSAATLRFPRLTELCWCVSSLVMNGERV